MNAHWKRLAGIALGTCVLLAAAPALQEEPGYDDTPMLPGTPWRVHDRHRPRPPIVTPPGACLLEPPGDAVVLFDGTDLSAWASTDGGAAGWTLREDGSMEVAPGGSLRTREEFGDCQLHLEFLTPDPPEGSSQERGNSGVFLMGRYEVQVLDSFDSVTYADGQAAALYGQAPPLVNACLPPGQWQSYDLVFRAPRFEGERLVQPGFVTVLHNGVLVHDHQEILGATTHRQLPRHEPHGPAGPLVLQDHGNPVRYRNVWLRRL
jgi:hypothetical protein